MPMPKKDKEIYDAVIIGAGIGGLVCGCYLAKAGMKVLIVEQHHKPGGYCTSFKRKDFTFDVAVHYIGAARHGGIINKILTELSLTNRIELIKFDPCDKIILPDGDIYIRRDYEDTMDEFR